MVRPLPSGSLLNACTCALRQATSSTSTSRLIISARPTLSSSFSTSLRTSIDLSDLDTFAQNQPKQPKPSPSTPKPPNRRTSNSSTPKTLHLSPAERAAEFDRREALHKNRTARRAGISPEKQYALERERERVYNSKLDKRHPKEAERLLRSAKAVGATAVFRPGGQRDGGAGGQRGRRDEGRGGGPGGRGGEARQGMVPGMVNLGTRVQGPRRDQIQPVVRGGAPRSVGGGAGGQRRRKQKKELKKVTLPSTIRLENLTNLLGVKLYHLQKAIERTGLGNSHPSRLLTAEDASLLALEFDFDPTIDDEAAFDIYPSPPPADRTTLPDRPPVTGIFGHVDHGKTSLLDALRSTSVASGEAGGITQHIGAFVVPVAAMVANLRAKQNGTKAPAVPAGSADGASITFLDTPGHAAFTAMRERGADVTDVIVLVVAADDGVKPQTEEVIGLIKSADVGVVVALTKCDKPGVDTLKVKQSLMAAGVEIEDFGGEIPCVEVSSVTGQGLPELLETISAIAEVRELKAEREGRAEGRVLEARVEKGRGNVATVLVHRGCLRPAASIIAGQTWCRVRSLVPASGGTTTTAFPGQPVEVTGWKDLPAAGDLVLEGANEDEVKKAVANRLAKAERDKLWADVERLNEQRATDSKQEGARRAAEEAAKEKGLKGGAVILAGEKAVEALVKEGGGGGEEVKELVLMIKADGSGTVEAVVGALQGIGNAEARVKIISSGVGDVQESDVEMARAIGGTIVGFNVKAPNAVLKAAARPPSPVKVFTSPIIYRLVDSVRSAVADLLPKTIETRVHGEAVVQAIFDISVKGRKTPKKVAGCKVANGVFQKGRKARVVRGGEVVFVGVVDTLKQVKKDVVEVTKGVECGIALEEFEGLEVDDLVQSVEEVEVARTL